MTFPTLEEQPQAVGESDLRKWLASANYGTMSPQALNYAVRYAPRQIQEHARAYMRRAGMKETTSNA